MTINDVKNVNGPYKRPDGRLHITAVVNGKRTSVSYPKYLLLLEGHEFGEDDTVDHIDRNFNNNDLPNLQILPRSEHAKKDAISVKPVELICLECGKTFGRTVRTVNNSAVKKKAGPFCSKVCVGKYGSDVQNNKREKLEPQSLLEVEYFYKR